MGGIDDYCLLASGNFSLIFPPLQDNLLMLPGNNNTWVVPSSASAQGVCGDQASELNLRWMDKATDDENLLNLVITRIGKLLNEWESELKCDLSTERIWSFIHQYF